jgi:hypothetical protein
MRIAYIDESGDDGFPTYSSPLFVLTTLYVHYLSWRDAYETIIDFRRQLKKDFNFPIKLEMHTKGFLLGKDPYREFGWSNDDKLTICGLFSKLAGSLNIKIINTVIVKPRIKNRDYDVLDTALKYSVQRIENDLNLPANPNERFLIITDEGRVGKMRRTTRRIQRVNYIPSKFSQSPYRREIKTLIEDPLPKDSKESYFIQLCDHVACIVYLHGLKVTGVASYPRRLASYVSETHVRDWLADLRPAINLKASPSDEFGILYHPKQKGDL